MKTIARQAYDGPLREDGPLLGLFSTKEAS